VHFWPFDGWHPVAGASVVAEVNPALWKHAFPVLDRTPDQHDAYSVAAWMQQADRDGRLLRCLEPIPDEPERAFAGVEGWILGLD
jgi:hypothetical protein